MLYFLGRKRPHSSVGGGGSFQLFIKKLLTFKFKLS
jgi:hypothetical protein